MYFFKEISDTSYGLNFEFEINNVTMSEKPETRDTAYNLIQDSINTVVSLI